LPFPELPNPVPCTACGLVDKRAVLFIWPALDVLEKQLEIPLLPGRLSGHLVKPATLRKTAGHHVDLVGKCR